MTDEGGEMKALERITDEARAEHDPSEPDWDRMEEALMARIDVDEQERSSKRSSRSYQVVAALAAAAALALGVGSMLRHSGNGEQASQSNNPAVQSTPRVLSEGPVDGNGLHVGDRVEAGQGELAVNHVGRVSWTLGAHGRAVLAETGDVVTVKLEEGAISASVVPNSRPETFAIEVGDARVAVHGTKFRVEKQADGLHVDVTEGVVAVGPASTRGHTSGWLLTRGDSGQFRLDGRSGDVNHPTAALVPVSPTAPKAPHVQPKAAAVLPPLTDSDISKGLGAITHATESCFDQNTPAEQAVKVQVRTDFTVVIGPDGKVTDLKFEPPLAPAVRACADAEGRLVQFPSSEKGATATRGLLLGK